MRKNLLGLCGWLLSVSLACGPKSGSNVSAEQTGKVSDPRASTGTLDYQPPGRSSGFTGVTDALGPLYIQDGEFDAEASTKPWSSWWYPVKDTYLFEGTWTRLSPLEKYDKYMRKLKGIKSTAAEYEKTVLHNPDAAGWEGHCGAWALASIVEPEPTQPIKAGGVVFEVADQKALLIKAYELAEGLTSYGQRYNGDSNSVYEDIYPDQFHRFLQVEVFDKHRPFIMDKDAGIPVWNTPMWKVYMKIKRDNNPNLMHVTTWLVGADPHVSDYNFVGTREVNFEYHYDLYGNLQPDGRFLVLFGKWTDKSVNDHPDFVTAVPEKVRVRSRNPQIKFEEVQGILHP